MKDASGPVTVTGNVDLSEAEDLTIDAAAIGKLMSMFSNQYSNGPLAVVREYFCNGDDSRIKAGSDRPTDVWLPTEVNPVLQVRDYGTGLDKAGLFSVFSTYGKSSKDDENDSTGHFGIGSKAAFTLASQFVVTGFKDGVKTTVLFFLNEHGRAKRVVQHEGPTTEPNGVLVEVGVPDVDAMRRSAHDFFLNVPKGRALVDGEPPEHMSDTVEFSRFNDEVMLVKDGMGRIRLQMGPVVYRVTREIMQAVAQRLDGLPSQAVAQAMVDWNSTDSVLMEVPMGSVTIAPSREDLRDTDATLNRIAAIVQGISDFIQHEIQDKIDAAPSRFAAMVILRDGLEALKGFRVRKSAFTWKGQEKAFKNEVELEHPVFFLTTRSWRSSAKIVGREDKHTVDFQRATKTLVVAGVAKDEVSKVSRYAKRFLENRDDIEFIMVSEQTRGGIDWFQYGIKSGAETMTLDEYRAALRAMRDANPRTRTEPSYTVGWNTPASRDVDDRDLLTDIIDQGKDLVIFHGSSHVSGEVRALLEKEDLYTPVVLMGTQSENALRERVEKDGTIKVYEGNAVKEAEDKIRAKIKAEVAPPTYDERVALGAAEWLSRNTRRYWRGDVREYRTEVLNWRRDLIEAAGGFPTPIHHPVFDNPTDAEDLARLLADDLTEDRRDDLKRLSRWCGVEFEAVEYEVEGSSMEAVFPLLHDFSLDRFRRNQKYRAAVIEYINSKA